MIRLVEHGDLRRRESSAKVFALAGSRWSGPNSNHQYQHRKKSHGLKKVATKQVMDQWVVSYSAVGLYPWIHPSLVVLFNVCYFTSLQKSLDAHVIYNKRSSLSKVFWRSMFWNRSGNPRGSNRHQTCGVWIRCMNRSLDMKRKKEKKVRLLAVAHCHPTFVVKRIKCVPCSVPSHGPSVFVLSTISIWSRDVSGEPSGDDVLHRVGSDPLGNLAKRKREN
jgi:hypothetical protein